MEFTQVRVSKPKIMEGEKIGRVFLLLSIELTADPASMGRKSWQCNYIPVLKYTYWHDFLPMHGMQTGSAVSFNGQLKTKKTSC